MNDYPASKKYKYIEFYRVFTKTKTPKYECVAGEGILLGHVKWKSQWRRFCFYTLSDCIIDHECLTDILLFLKEIITIRRLLQEKKENEK